MVFLKCTTGKLYIKNNETLYEQIFESQKETENTVDSEEGIEILKKEGVTQDNMKYVYRNNNNLVFKDLMAFRRVVVKEDKINFDWKLLKETKKINNYHCKKAKTFFRGRSYIAWYTEDITTNAGPWKFYGLPGLILELYDQDKILHIQATKIVFNFIYNISKKRIEIKIRPLQNYFLTTNKKNKQLTISVLKCLVFCEFIVLQRS